MLGRPFLPCEIREQMEAVESDAGCRRSRVESERRDLLGLDLPAEGPLRRREERGNRAHLGHGAEQAVPTLASKQIVNLHPGPPRRVSPTSLKGTRIMRPHRDGSVLLAI